jgi:hypothetical protein
LNTCIGERNNAAAATALTATTSAIVRSSAPVNIAVAPPIISNGFTDGLETTTNIATESSACGHKISINHEDNDDSGSDDDDDDDEDDDDDDDDDDDEDDDDDDDLPLRELILKRRLMKPASQSEGSDPYREPSKQPSKGKIRYLYLSILEHTSNSTLPYVYTLVTLLCIRRCWC